MKTDYHDGTLTIYLEGRIDSNNANETESQITDALSQNPEASNIQFDADKLDYISSAGLRVLLKVRKIISKPLPVLNASSEIYGIFDVTGFTELLDVHKKLREVSVDGCELLGEGANGKVYRLTKDEMIKIFRPEITLDIIESERESSRKAFLLGIPCAIAFDTVKCGESCGTIYEMLNAGTLTERIRANPDRLPELAEGAGVLLRQLHAIDVPEEQMPRVSPKLHGLVDKIADDFTPDEVMKMHALYNAIPEQNHFVHGDYHTKNIMESNGELMLIDLGDSGRGNPLLDLMHTYFVMNLTGGSSKHSDDDMGFVGLTYREMRTFWEIMFEAYCGGDTAKAEMLQAKIAGYAMMMYLNVSMAHPLLPKEYHSVYADKVRSEVLSHYDELMSIKWE
ncbi:MAG: phosphotransferase [Synergistaceae bacterium]|nr:phosphotransferase [Synergistaceae bacterium]